MTNQRSGFGRKQSWIEGSRMSNAKEANAAKLRQYAEQSNSALPETGFRLDRARAALVVVDPQIVFLSPSGATWPFFGESITENEIVANLEMLFKASKSAKILVAVSPHHHPPREHAWKFNEPLEEVTHDIRLFDRRQASMLDCFDGSRTDYLEQYKPYILDGRTIIAPPHNVYGPETNYLATQLRKHGVSQVILAGMASNICFESHLRELIAQGFEVVIVRDAITGPRVPEENGYLAALINYRFLAHALWTTKQTVRQLTEPS
ncbi:nicotinamidase-related amidase [Paraburkholderia sp. JPY171]|nr:nicotinamidase-related amidase [Paraburkholderia atlantica]